MKAKKSNTIELLKEHGYKMTKDFGLNKLLEKVCDGGNTKLLYSHPVTMGLGLSFRVFNSLQCQTFDDFEWLIIDDGSDDDYKKCC